MYGYRITALAIVFLLFVSAPAFAQTGLAVDAPLRNIQVALVVFGILAQAIIGGFMLIFLVTKRCPLCGAGLKLDYKGKKITGYQCNTCRYYTVREK